MVPVISGQRSLLGGGRPALGQPARPLSGLQRRSLDDGAWVDYMTGFVTGHEALMEALVETTHWKTGQREMYEKIVEVPRLVAGLPADGPGHPLIEEMRAVLSAHYATEFARTGVAYYRDGRDSVAWHGDYIARELQEALVATVSLGEPRRFLLRRKLPNKKNGDGGGGVGPSIAYNLGWGDLIVMGGTCQRTWQHAIPKVGHAAPRLVIMFRPVWEAPPGAYRPPGY
jgi:alkylated DNA repair dioxygenase AlkB